MKTTLILTEDHLNKALAQPWSTTTCLLATALAEHLKGEVVCCGANSAHVKIDGIQRSFIIQNATPAVQYFDSFHGRDQGDLENLKEFIGTEIIIEERGE